MAKQKVETKITKQYKAKSCASFGNKKAQVYGEALDKIQLKHNGKITQRIVLKEAKKRNNPLHNYFEWDDRKASEKFRLHQANTLLSSIDVVVTYQGTEKETNAYYNVRAVNDNNDETSRCYVVVDKVLDNKDLRAQVLAKAISQIEYWEQTYKDFVELEEIFEAIQRTKSRIRF